MHSSAGINLSKPDGDFGFALNDSNFSDKILKIEIMAADEESKSGGEVVTCKTPLDWAPRRKRRTEIRGSQALTGRLNNIVEVLEDWITFSSQQQSQNNWLNLGMVVAWNIWNERCEAIFQNKKANPNGTARNALNFAYYLSSLSDKANRCSHTTSVPSPSIAIWKPYDCPYLTVNCDASYDENTGLTGIGVILRDFAGKWKGCRVKYYTGVADSERAECLAVHEAMAWCMELQISHAMFETDLNNIESFINNASPVIAWENESLLQDVIHITVMFPNGKCPFIPRKCNKPADELAKFSRKSSITQVWLDSPPQVVKRLLVSDNITFHN